MNLSILIVGALALPMPAAAQDTSGQPHRKPVAAPDANVVLHEHLQALLRHPADNEVAEPRPMLGVQLSSLQGAVAAQLPEYVQPALILTLVYEGSPAEKAGLRVHDVLSAIDGDGKLTLERLRETLASKQPGDTVSLEVFRRGQRQMVNVAVENFSPPPQVRVPDQAHIPDVGYWATYEGEHPWPRFGVSPDGEILVQHDENGAWEDTDASVEDHDSLQYWLHSGNEYLDLSTPHVDPDGTLRHQIDHLRSLYSEESSNQVYLERQTGHLEHRIVELERKLEEMNGALHELLELSRR